MTAVKVPIKVQKRSGFDKSHHNALSQKVGSIVPLLTDEVIPNSKVYLRYAMAGSLPPLASDTYMKCYYDIRAFFCPMRLLYGGFESFFNDYPYNVISGSSTNNITSQVKSSLPYFSIDKDNSFIGILGDGELSDYLGYKFEIADVANLDKDVEFSAMPFLCYHMICDTWFRQPNIQVSAFARLGGGSAVAYTCPISGMDYAPAILPYVSPDVGREVIPVASNDAFNDPKFQFADGVSIFSLRNCNYDYDYFTNALPSAQLGTPLTVSTSGGSFTIASLRAANSLQQFSELNGLAGSNTVDVVKARYGANLSHGLANKPVYLGGARIDIATKSVETTTNVNGSNNTTNPFINSVGSSGGRAIIQGTDLLVDDFVANEPGYIMVVGCVIPKVTYGSGVRRYLRHYIGAGSLTDMANPLLQNVGNQPIYQYELNGSLGITGGETAVFGYTDRYAEFMSMEDEVHGLFRFGSNLDSFVAQRYWNNTDSPVIGTNFLTVPNSALNNITMITSDLARFGFYGQFAFDYKVSQPLAQYSLPSLQNPAYEHGKTVKVHRGGFRF